MTGGITALTYKPPNQLTIKKGIEDIICVARSGLDLT